MKKLVFALVTLFCLLSIFSPNESAAEGPDGFANVPWGANKHQADQIVAQQGFRSSGKIVGSSYGDAPTAIGYRYHGKLAGTSGNVELWFLNGTFFRGNFWITNEDGGDAEAEAYRQFLPLIQSKYGSPTKSRNTRGSYPGVISEWEGLQVLGSSDTVRIILAYDATTSRCGNGFCSSHFNLLYTNQSLLGRLARQNKDGL